jgi:hypothetical protein
LRGEQSKKVLNPFDRVGSKYKVGKARESRKRPRQDPAILVNALSGNFSRAVKIKAESRLF